MSNLPLTDCKRRVLELITKIIGEKLLPLAAKCILGTDDKLIGSKVCGL